MLIDMTMDDYGELYARLPQTPIAAWLQPLPAILSRVWQQRHHGDWEKWQTHFQDLPDLTASTYDLNQATIRIGTADDASAEDLSRLATVLRHYHPWRKGPYTLFGCSIDTEWRSDWKWQRLLPHLSNLDNRCVLDVGCGNGYHLWRMRAAGAKLVIGVDPSLFFLMQFRIMQKYIQDHAVHLLPLKSEELPAFNKPKQGFDTVLSMGVFYHRRSPLDHLLELKHCLRSGGELVLETLVVDGDENTMLVPEDRYAQMRNVWFLPSTLALERLLRRVGFINIRTVDVCRTTTNEQRSTEWMQWESLADFLDPHDNSRSIEGYQAPTRAIVLANLP